MYPVFGLQGSSWFLGVSEWLFGALIFLGFWNKKLGILGAAGSCVTFIMTITIIPFMSDGWNAAAGGFPAIRESVQPPTGTNCVVVKLVPAKPGKPIKPGNPMITIRRCLKKCR